MRTYCIAQEFHSVLCTDLYGSRIQKKGGYIHKRFTLLDSKNLTQHCKSTMLQ